MALYVIADLHLSSDGSKSMEVFGSRWKDYMQKIEKNWRRLISDDDTVILPGDLSWALKLEDAVDDLLFLNSLPGTKLIGKGNHDFWWSTAAKMNALMEKHQITTLHMLYNNAHRVENIIVCGTRGWFVEESQQHTVGSTDYMKIVNREVIRLKLSLDEAKKLQSDATLPIAVFLHFPPVWNGFVCREIVDTLHTYGVNTCYFGHIHGNYHLPSSFDFEEIKMRLCSADSINFTPLPVFL